MKKIVAVILVSLISFAAQASDRTLICMMGDSGDIDIKIESLGSGKERLSVVLGDMAGDSVIFKNSSFENGQLSKALDQGNLVEVVSISDLDDVFGGAYLNAGLLSMTYNSSARAYDVKFAAQKLVHTATCR